MKKILVAAIALVCAVSIVQAQDAKGKTKLTDEQKQARKDLIAKYDTNKDGKLDKDERAKISKEELEKAGLAHHGKASKTTDSK